jgi:CubicO group peptidase (beta-lactamase class C family)
MKIRYTLLLIFVTCIINCAAQKATTSLTNISQFLDNAERNLDFHGTVLLVQGNDTLLHQGYGYSDRKKRTPTNKNIAYNIASVTKGFTAVAILKLVQDGKLSLQDPLTKYFENVPEKVTGLRRHKKYLT